MVPAKEKTIGSASAHIVLATTGGFGLAKPPSASPPLPTPPKGGSGSTGGGGEGCRHWRLRKQSYWRALAKAEHETAKNITVTAETVSSCCDEKAFALLSLDPSHLSVCFHEGSSQKRAAFDCSARFPRPVGWVLSGLCGKSRTLESSHRRRANFHVRVISSIPPMIRITSPHFCAGVVLRNGIVVRAAPILNYMFGWTGERVLAYARRRGWQTHTTDEAA